MIRHLYQVSRAMGEYVGAPRRRVHLATVLSASRLAIAQADARSVKSISLKVPPDETSNYTGDTSASSGHLDIDKRESHGEYSAEGSATWL